MKTLIWTGIALVALAGPGLAQAQTLLTTPSTTSSAVTTTIAPACAIEGTTSPITVSVGLNGGPVTGAGPNEGGLVKITCNTPAGVVSIGSNDMVNTTGQPIVETTIFTDTIKFVGGAKPVTSSATSGWRLASRATNTWGAWQSARLDANTANLRIMEVGINAFDFDTLTKIPTAGDYAGTVCVTVNPAGIPANAPGNANCP